MEEDTVTPFGNGGKAIQSQDLLLAAKLQIMRSYVLKLFFGELPLFFSDEIEAV